MKTHPRNRPVTNFYASMPALRRGVTVLLCLAWLAPSLAGAEEPDAKPLLEGRIDGYRGI